MGSYLLNSSKELTSRSYNMSYGDSYRRRSRSPAYGRDRDRYDRDDRSRHNRDRQEDRRRDDRYERRRSPPRQRSGGFGGSSKKVERTKFGILCRNLSSRVNWMDLKDLARRYGEVTYTDANSMRRDGVMTFTSKKDMVEAYENLQGKELFGKQLELEYEFPETLEEQWRGEINNDHPSGERGDSRREERRSRTRSKSSSRGRYDRRSRSRSRSYSR